MQVIIISRALLVLSLVVGVTYSISLDSDKPRKCYNCEGIQCERSLRANATIHCTDLLDVCVTVFDGNLVTARGCFLDLSMQMRKKCENSGIAQGQGQQGQCLKCIGDLCNDRGRTSCVQCNSNSNSKCTINAEEIAPKNCDVPTSPNSYCFVRFDKKAKIERGCSLTIEDQMQCLNDRKCSLCLPDDVQGSSGACNTYVLNPLRNSATTTQKMMSLGGIFTVLLIKFFN